MFCKNCKHVNYKHLNSRSACRIKDCDCPAFIKQRPAEIHEVTEVELNEMRRMEQAWFAKLKDDELIHAIQMVEYYRKYVILSKIKGEHSEEYLDKYNKELQLTDSVIEALQTSISSLDCKIRFKDKRNGC